MCVCVFAVGLTVLFEYCCYAVRVVHVGQAVGGIDGMTGREERLNGGGGRQ